MKGFVWIVLEFDQFWTSKLIIDSTAHFHFEVGKEIIPRGRVTGCNFTDIYIPVEILGFLNTIVFYLRCILAIVFHSFRFLPRIVAGSLDPRRRSLSPVVCATIGSILPRLPWLTKMVWALVERPTPHIHVSFVRLYATQLHEVPFLFV